MVGLTHVALRLAMRKYLPEGVKTIWPSEMLNSRKIPIENLRTTPETLRHENETELVPQVLGNEKESIQKSIECLKNWGAEGIDINMGCPVQKALKHNYGVSLMGDIEYAGEVVRYAVEASDLPVSVKLRAGLQNDFSFLLRFTENLQKSGASWLTLHPRTAEQKRRGFADWNQIKELKKNLSIPLIGNGDIQAAGDVLQMLEETNCDMVMSGRALAAKPWMLAQVAVELHLVKSSEVKIPHTEEEAAIEYGRHVLNVLSLCFEYFKPDLALRKFRFFIRHTSVWLEFGHTLYSICTKHSDKENLSLSIEKFFESEQKMYGATNLRE